MTKPCIFIDREPMSARRSTTEDTEDISLNFTGTAGFQMAGVTGARYPGEMLVRLLDRHGHELARGTAAGNTPQVIFDSPVTLEHGAHYSLRWTSPNDKKPGHP